MSLLFANDVKHSSSILCTSLKPLKRYIIEIALVALSLGEGLVCKTRLYCESMKLNSLRSDSTAWALGFLNHMFSLDEQYN